jgi:hypothetical protein
VQRGAPRGRPSITTTRSSSRRQTPLGVPGLVLALLVGWCLSSPPAVRDALGMCTPRCPRPNPMPWSRDEGCPWSWGMRKVREHSCPGARAQLPRDHILACGTPQLATCGLGSAVRCAIRRAGRRLNLLCKCLLARARGRAGVRERGVCSCVCGGGIIAHGGRAKRGKKRCYTCCPFSVSVFARLACVHLSCMQQIRVCSFVFSLSLSLSLWQIAYLHALLNTHTLRQYPYTRTRKHTQTHTNTHTHTRSRPTSRAGSPAQDPAPQALFFIFFVCTCVRERERAYACACACACECV